MKHKILLILAIASIVLAGCTQANQQSTQQAAISNDSAGIETSGNAATPQTVTVLITQNGFEPKSIEINAGDTVVFKNTTENPSWPASAKHPTHTVYPNSGIEKCGTADESKIFDACKGLSKDETFSFTFNEKGTWGYHDHLNFPGPTGTIVVK